MVNSVYWFIAILIDAAIVITIVRWYRRRNKPVGEIIISEKEDGTLVYAFDFDNYDHPKTFKDRKKVVFKVVRARLEDSS